MEGTELLSGEFQGPHAEVRGLSSVVLEYFALLGELEFPHNIIHSLGFLSNVRRGLCFGVIREQLQPLLDNGLEHECGVGQLQRGDIDAGGVGEGLESGLGVVKQHSSEVLRLAGEVRPLDQQGVEVLAHDFMVGVAVLDYFKNGQ